MPAMIDDPTAPTIHRVSGAPPFPNTDTPLPPSITPIHLTLKDNTTKVTILPFTSYTQVPDSLWQYLATQLNAEIEAGTTYPMLSPMDPLAFAKYWFQNFAAIMLLGHHSPTTAFSSPHNWETECLGTFYIKPNYPGRSSHICNAGFLVTTALRNKGVGRKMGEAYLEWAPRLGYTYSVFNLVYESNVASCRIWDALGFERIGRVPRCGNLRGCGGVYVDAIIYGRGLVGREGTGEGKGVEGGEEVKEGV